MAEAAPTTVGPGTIVRLKVENIKRLEMVEVEPDGSLVIVSGKNDQGKSSVLDSIRFALGGPKAMSDTPEVVREGEIAGRVMVEFEDLVVLRTMTDGKQAVKLTWKSGAQKGTPQALLDSFLTALSFNPLEFAKLDAKKQRETLIGLVDLGIDPDEIDQQHAAAYALRTTVNGEVTRLTQVLATSPSIPSETPDEPVSASAIVEQMETAQAQAAAAVAARAAIETRQTTISTITARVAQMKQQLAEAERLLGQHEGALAADEAAIADLPVPADVAPLREQLAQVDEINAAVRAKQARAEQRAALEAEKLKSKNLTDELARLMQVKTDALAAADMPIDGLSFTADGVTFNGIPLSQTSESGRVKVSAAIQMALNPGCKVMLIDNGNALDEDNLAVLREMAEANGHQIWMTWVGQHDESAVVISEGKALTK
jgi:hypothetical protein